MEDEYMKRFIALILSLILVFSSLPTLNGFAFDTYPELSDSGNMSDKELFGEWDSENNVWIVAPILRYDLYSGLDKVMEASKADDYQSAKEFLLTYYRTLPDERKLLFKPSKGYDYRASAILDKIFTYTDIDTILGEIHVGTEEGWYTADLDPSISSVSGSYWILDSDMDGSSAIFSSKEAGDEYAPYLTIESSEGRYTVRAAEDTYISAGSNIDTNFGTEDKLYVKEASEGGKPFGAETGRTYVRFDMSGYTSVSPSSVKLNFYGKADGTKSKKLYIYTMGGKSKTFDETQFKWSDHHPQTFCFKQTGYIWETVENFETQWNTEFEWINFCSRMYQAQYALRQYLTDTSNEDYAYRALEIIMSIYNQKPYGDYPRPLDGGWRIEMLIRSLYTALNSEHMTAEIFTAMVKYIYIHLDTLKDVTLNVTNQDSAVKVNIARICTYLPEIVPDGQWKKSRQNLYEFYTGKLLNADGSYTEGCSNYITGVIEEFLAAIEMIGLNDGTDHPYYVELTDLCHNLMTYYMNIAFSNGVTVPYGDGGRNGTYEALKEYIEKIPDDNILYFVTQGDEGKEPDYTSRLYSSKAVCMLRSGWHPDDLCAFINTEVGVTHGHGDELSLDVSAYGYNLLVDAGVSSYSPDSVFATEGRYLVSNHNTIEIDGQNQTYGTNVYPEAGYTNLKTNKFFDFLHAKAATVAYEGFDINRKVLMIKNKYLIVSDYIIPPDNSTPHDYRLLWHPDYNSGIKLNRDTGLAYTTKTGAPNIKIITSHSNENEASIFQRMMNNPSYGEVYSNSVQYVKTAVAGPIAYDSVLLPQNIGEDTDLIVQDIALDSTAQYEATAMRIYIGDNIAHYYSANDDNAVTRSFDGYSYNGEMAYIEKDADGKLVSVAITNGSLLKENDKEIISSAENINDLGVRYDSTKLELFTEESIPSDGVKILTDKTYSKVLLNGEEVDFSYEGSYVVTNGETKSDSDSSNQGGSDDVGTFPDDSDDNEGSGNTDGESTGDSNDSGNTGSTDNNPTKPSNPGTSSGTNGGGSAGGTVVPPVDTDKPDEVKNNFTDTEEHWASLAINYLYEKGIISGKGDGKFYPDDNITRAEFVKLIAEIAKLDLDVDTEKAFDDVDSSAWYASYIYAAYMAGIVSGTSDTTFNPDDNITREQMAKMICNILDFIDSEFESQDKLSFNDSDEISAWAVEFVERLSSLGLVEGDENANFRPLGTLTRAEAATVLYRLLNKEGK